VIIFVLTVGAPPVSKKLARAEPPGPEAGLTLPHDRPLPDSRATWVLESWGHGAFCGWEARDWEKPGRGGNLFHRQGPLPGGEKKNPEGTHTTSSFAAGLLLKFLVRPGATRLDVLGVHRLLTGTRIQRSGRRWGGAGRFEGGGGRRAGGLNRAIITNDACLARS